MDDDGSRPLTELLHRAASGDGAAADEVFGAIYAELKRLAAIQRGRVPAGHTLVTTAVVHEAYLRLFDGERISWNDRHHFFCAAARAMRDLLVEEARRKRSLKRGGDLQRVGLPEIAGVSISLDQIHDLDRALVRLEREIPEDAQIVLLRYFTGLSMPETAEVLGRPLRVELGIPKVMFSDGQDQLRRRR